MSWKIKFSKKRLLYSIVKRAYVGEFYVVLKWLIFLRFFPTSLLEQRQASSQSNVSDNIDSLPPTVVKLEERLGMISSHLFTV